MNCFENHVTIHLVMSFQWREVTEYDVMSRDPRYMHLQQGEKRPLPFPVPAPDDDVLPPAVHHVPEDRPFRRWRRRARYGWKHRWRRETGVMRHVCNVSCAQLRASRRSMGFREPTECAMESRSTFCVFYNQGRNKPMIIYGVLASRETIQLRVHIK